ncbi:MAG: 4-alpha-glucanotransferase [Eubacteriales bacterium]|nr:4-alpha-glucanotransferase [Eubacteriales bacterium]
MRASGILLAISSIPSRYGIGCFSKEAYSFVDTLVEAGQKYWQILPLGPTGYGDSPYQSFSTFAGNPYFIDLEELIKEGLLEEWECSNCDWGGSESYVDYDKLYQSRFMLLRKAFERSNIEEDEEFQTFVKENEFWLDDYSLYMAIKNAQGGKNWSEWPDDLKKRKVRAMKQARVDLKQEIMFYCFQQYWFCKQWTELKAYANEKGVSIIGDVPIYVSTDSSDAWANPKLFQYDKDANPKAVAGCPPDAFSETGQLWGNPLYDWKYHKKTGYEWWIARVKRCMELYDVVRMDHFRGFDEYYAVPYGDETAVNGKWEKGPGMDLFNALQENVEDLNVIAEDLGLMTDGVRKLLKDSGYPGMKVLQFAFDDSYDSDYLPYKYDKNCVVYTGTHDNETTRGWLEGLNQDTRRYVGDYVHSGMHSVEDGVWGLMHVALGSPADLAIIPIQDYLCLGNEARMNTPSTFGNNWKWRLTKDQIQPHTVHSIHELTKIYGRLAKK